VKVLKLRSDGLGTDAYIPVPAIFYVYHSQATGGSVVVSTQGAALAVDMPIKELTSAIERAQSPQGDEIDVRK
jgi:hypothetical protein